MTTATLSAPEAVSSLLQIRLLPCLAIILLAQCHTGDGLSWKRGLVLVRLQSLSTSECWQCFLGGLLQLLRFACTMGAFHMETDLISGAHIAETGKEVHTFPITSLVSTPCTSATGPCELPGFTR